jgi:hypothetical protein
MVQRLAGMPEPWRLERVEGEGEVFIFRGPHLFARYDGGDIGMRNLAIIALTNAGDEGSAMGSCFGLTRQYVSMLRSRAKYRGSEGLVRPRGRHRALSPAKLFRAAAMSKQGMTNTEIAKHFGVHIGTIGRRLAAMTDPAGPDLPLGGDALFDGDKFDAGVDDEPMADGVDLESNDVVTDFGHEPGSEDDTGAGAPAVEVAAGGEDDIPPGPLQRLGQVEVSFRYAGAMLLHASFTRLGADEILSSLSTGAARRYDAASLVLLSAFSLALGTSSMEATKHLVSADAGALLGAEAFPHLRTLRQRLKTLAEASDLMEPQSAFAKAMLHSDERQPDVFYVDDHFVTYWGEAPVAKCYNIRRHLAEPGRDDTFVVDDSWQAICFSSGEPRGLSVTFPEVLSQLKEIVGGRRFMVGFDRGGSYPKDFEALEEANMDWITWRRAPLVIPTVPPKRSWVEVAGTRRTSLLADELVELNGYCAGPVRQLSAYEYDKVVFQILTSNHDGRGVEMVHTLRSRWCIENSNKYLEHHQGIHWLCNYEMDAEANTAKVTNPARRAARATVNNAEAAVTEAERVLGRQSGNAVSDMDVHLAKFRVLRDDVAIADDELEAARQGLKGIPAKLPANVLDPAAKRAKPHLAARALQMVSRLLAYNAELDLARHLNPYLADNDEYRAIARNLLHLGGRITFERKRITVTLDRPNSPKVARALGLLLGELAAGTPGHLAGDRRPIT